ALTLTFSQPVAAFGVTFMHYNTTYSGNQGQSSPAQIEVFDSSSNLLGIVLSSGFLNGLGTPDFVALQSDAVDIATARISGTAATKAYAADTYALSLIPQSVPEPAGMILLPLILSLRLRR